MTEQEFENMVNRLFKLDFSAGTEDFRENLLSRCLDTLGTDDVPESDSTACRELTDSELDLLAAAGDAYLPINTSLFGDNKIL